MTCHHCKKAYKLKSRRGHRRRYCSGKCARKARWQRTKANKNWRLKAREAAKASREKRTNARWLKIFAIHGDRCCKCKHKYPRCCYDLHHTKLGVKKSKHDNSAVVIRDGSDAQFEALLKITELICANCHRILHDNGKPYGRI